MKPKVIEQYKSDGGYLVTFMNDKKVNKSVFCFVHEAGSPYKLLNLNARNNYDIFFYFCHEEGIIAIAESPH